MTQIAKGEYPLQSPRDERVRKVLVVGGGSSGWMAAAALATALARDVEVQLVESEAIGIVGVGDFYLEEGAGIGVQGGVPELVGVHFAEALIALDIEALAAGGEDGFEQADGAVDSGFA